MEQLTNILEAINLSSAAGDSSQLLFMLGCGALFLLTTRRYLGDVAGTRRRWKNAARARFQRPAKTRRPIDTVSRAA